MLLMSTWRTKKKVSILKGKANWNSVGESASRQRELILRNNGTISVPSHSQSTGAENFFIVDRLLSYASESSHQCASNEYIQQVLWTLEKTCLFKYTENFTTKNENFQRKNSDIFSYFCSKHRLWVLVRTASTRRFVVLVRTASTRRF